jgi:hypothetical protein
VEPSLSLPASRTESDQRASRAQPSFAKIQVSVRRDRSALAGRRAGRLREFGRPRWYDEFVVERRASAAEEHWGRRSPDGRRDQLQAASATSGEQPHTYPAIDGANNGERPGLLGLPAWPADDEVRVVGRRPRTAGSQLGVIGDRTSR